ncbi:MAG: hypothetical protein E6G08_15390 [Actinobacteria bacterium]|nr:MAG: hypothetical protein E6G08_15390 [Actinomycetota bacterium]
MVEAAKLPTPLPSLDDANGGRRLPLGSLLVREGLLTREQLEQALAEKERTGHRIGEIVVERGWAQPQDVARALAEQHGLEFVDLAQAKLEPAAANLLPEKFARRYDALPVRFLDEASCSSRTISASRSASTSASPSLPRLTCTARSGASTAHSSTSASSRRSRTRTRLRSTTSARAPRRALPRSSSSTP